MSFHHAMLLLTSPTIFFLCVISESMYRDASPPFSNVSTQQAAVEVLRAEFKTLKPRDAKTILMECRYDIDDARSKILSRRSAHTHSSSSKKDDGRRRPVSYAAAVGQGLRGSDTGNDIKGRIGVPVPKEQSRPSLRLEFEDAHPESTATSGYEEPGLDSGRRREINRHFLQVFLSKNTSYRAMLSPCGREVRFGGPAPTGRYHPDLRAIKMDLHGLSVMHALQIVGSCLDWLLHALSPHSATFRNFSLTYSKEVDLSFVVGLGLHSNGGKRKLAPAVRRFLEGRGLVCKSQPGDAVITCCFRI